MGIDSLVSCYVEWCRYACETWCQSCDLWSVTSDCLTALHQWSARHRRQHYCPNTSEPSAVSWTTQRSTFCATRNNVKPCSRLSTAHGYQGDKQCTKKPTRSCPLTLKFNRVLEVVHVHAKFRQAKCSDSWVIEVAEQKRTPMKTILSVSHYSGQQ